HLHHLHPADHPGPRLVHPRVRPLRGAAREPGARRGRAGPQAGQPGRGRGRLSRSLPAHKLKTSTRTLSALPSAGGVLLCGAVICTYLRWVLVDIPAGCYYNREVRAEGAALLPRKNADLRLLTIPPHI